MLNNIVACTIRDVDTDKVSISGLCRITSKPYTVQCTAKGVQSWIDGAYIQQALPELSIDDREFLISGTSPEGWKLLFGDNPEE